MKTFSEYLKEQKNGATVTVAFGRLNPPTIGHEKLIDATRDAAKGGEYRVYLSQTQDKKKNPLSYEEKIKYARKMFPRHSRAIILNKKIKTILDLMSELYKEGYRNVRLVAGSDRVPEYERLISQYNGKEMRNGFYNFDSIQIVSAGERDPDAEGTTGMSASKLRNFAKENDFENFSKGVPANFAEKRQLFNDIRKNMGLSESRSLYQFKPISDIRESYVSGDLYSIDDIVIDNHTQKECRIVKLGPNFLVVEDITTGQQSRKWLTDVSEVTANQDRVKAQHKRRMENEKDEFERELSAAKVADFRVRQRRKLSQNTETNESVNFIDRLRGRK